MSARVLAVRAIPVLGWLYLLAGARSRGVWRAIWWVDLFLSVVVHAAQIPAALRAARGTGRSPVATAALTQIFGLTYWKTTEAAR